MERTVNAVLAALDGLEPGKERRIVAIDGRCGAGKTTLAEAIRRRRGCAVIPMDAFFLPPERRTAERLNEPGGNVDRERFLLEVLEPLVRGVPFAYRPYDCGTDSLGAPVKIVPGPLTVVEGSYSCHPVLRDAYDLRVFLTVDPVEQLARIKKRNGEACARRFATTWIPLEERYFTETGAAERCDLLLTT